MVKIKVEKDPALRGDLKDSFVVQVADDSMIEYNLCEGDTLLVKADSAAVDGDIAVVSVEGACCLRKIKYTADGRVLLLAGDSVARSRALPLKDLEVYGVVKGVFRAL